MLGLGEDSHIDELREEVALLKRGLQEREEVRELEQVASRLRQENEELRTKLGCQDLELNNLRRSKEEVLLEVITEKQARIADTEELMLMRDRCEQADEEIRTLQDRNSDLQRQLEKDHTHGDSLRDSRESRATEHNRQREAPRPPLTSPTRRGGGGGGGSGGGSGLHNEMASHLSTLEAHLR